MHVGPAAVLFLLPLGGPFGGPSPFQIVADARSAVLGRGEEVGRAVGRVGELEWAAYEHWNDPGGPHAQLTALILAHEAAAEAQLAPILGPDVLAKLRLLRDRCHAAGRGGAPPPGAGGAFLDALREHRPAFSRGLERAPSVRAILLAAVTTPGRPVRFDPAEPTLSTATTAWVGGEIHIRVSQALERAAGGRPEMAAVLFEAFNAHTGPATRTLNAAAEAGAIDRDAYAMSRAALEQFSVSNVLRVLRDHYAELAAAGLTYAPRHWCLPGFPRFAAPPPGLRVPTAKYPFFPFGSYHDRKRVRRTIVRRSGFWEAAVCTDRLRFHSGPSPGELRAIGLVDARLDALGAGDPWYLLHQSLPAAARYRLATVRGGESVEAFCRAVPWAFLL